MAGLQAVSHLHDGFCEVKRFLQLLFWGFLMSSSTMIAVTILALSITAAPATAHQQPSSPAAGQQKKDAPVPITGELLAVDDKTKTIIVKAGDSEMKFSYSDQTQIVGADKGVEGLTGKSGTIVKVTYDEHGTANVATRIEVSKKA
jgi:hypothetical protein